MTNNSSLKNLYQDVLLQADPEKALQAQRFFKTGKGEYAQWDKFLWLTVPQSRTIVKKYRNLALQDLTTLIHSERHEHRLIALLIAVHQYNTCKDSHLHKQLFDRYSSHTTYINNRDLVDTSAEHIVWQYLHNKDKKLLIDRAHSSLLRKRRIAIIATFYEIKQWNPVDTIHIAELLLHDTHDLIHKAVWWMLREVGKRCGEKYLTDFLDTYSKTMPRTILRYSIEKLSTDQKKMYMRKI